MAQACKIIPLHNWNEKLAESFREFEGDVCELALMAKLAEREIESVLDGLGAADPEREAYDRGMFAISHVARMIEALKARYYAEYEAARS